MKTSQSVRHLTETTIRFVVNGNSYWVKADRVSGKVLMGMNGVASTEVEHVLMALVEAVHAHNQSCHTEEVE
jgi:hypothetical protein